MWEYQGGTPGHRGQSATAVQWDAVGQAIEEHSLWPWEVLPLLSPSPPPSPFLPPLPHLRLSTKGPGMRVNRPLRSTQRAPSPAPLHSVSWQGAPGPEAVEQGLLPAGPGQVARLGPAHGHCRCRSGRWWRPCSGEGSPQVPPDGGKIKAVI